MQQLDVRRLPSGGRSALLPGHLRPPPAAGLPVPRLPERLLRQSWSFLTRHAFPPADANAAKTSGTAPRSRRRDNKREGM